MRLVRGGRNLAALGWSRLRSMGVLCQDVPTLPRECDNTSSILVIFGGL